MNFGILDSKSVTLFRAMLDRRRDSDGDDYLTNVGMQKLLDHFIALNIGTQGFFKKGFLAFNKLFPTTHGNIKRLF